MKTIQEEIDELQAYAKMLGLDVNIHANFVGGSFRISERRQFGGHIKYKYGENYWMTRQQVIECLDELHERKTN